MDPQTFARGRSALSISAEMGFTEICEYLIEQGIDASRVSIASFGEYKPVQSGKDATTKAKNRRVEIMLRMANTTVTQN